MEEDNLPHGEEANGDDLLGESFVFKSVYARKKHPELMPVLSRDLREIHFTRYSSYSLSTDNRFNGSTQKLSDSCFGAITTTKENQLSGGPKRAVSMTRLDQLAKPRQRYLEESMRLRNIATASLISPLARSTIFTPSRPTSSIGGSSEQTPTSSALAPVRRRKASRKPRPVSTIACFPDNKSISSQSSSLKSPITPTTISSIPNSAIVTRSNRARSTGSLNRKPIESKTSTDDSNNCDNQVKPVPPTKPAHIKAAAARKIANIQQKSVDKSNSSTILKTNNKSDDVSDRDKITNCDRKSGQKPTLWTVLTDSKKMDNNSTSNNNNKDVNKSKIFDYKVSDSVGNGAESETCLNQGQGSTSGSSNNNSSSQSGSKKNISAEEYKRVLAENQRLAKQQAAREAEAQRQREEAELEEARRLEQERMRVEEERLIALEAEQTRLAEEHRRMQEEKLRLAMEEQRKREEEERRKKEEEARLQREREEAEAKAEKARLDLEERLRKDEEERLLRKKRVEAIINLTKKSQNKNASLSYSDESRTPDSSNEDTSYF